ncbi:MAG: xylulokinase [Notoacmeibacter sp.]|nr:xylulokinase [Notoacmeibacter sp.]
MTQLGIDLGTSGVKALLIDDNQRILAAKTAPLGVSRLHQGWSEQTPADWVDAVSDAVGRIAAEHPAEMSAVRGIGLSGQMHGATLLDKADRVLRPAILWNDTRCGAEATVLDADPLFRSVSGNIVFPGFTAPKLVWIRNHEPDIFGRVSKVLLPKDYLRLWLTGEHVSDMSDSAGTGWLDTGARKWSRPLLSACGMTEDQMPRLVEGTEVSGTLRRDLAQEWGMGPGVVVAGGGGDNAASAIGMGTVKSGSAFVSLGTSGVLFAANDSYKPNPASAVHAFCHALPDTWHQMGVMLSATDSLNWFANLTGTAAAKLASDLGNELRRPSPVTFLPYISGERTPHNSASVRGLFAGLGHESGRTELTQALFEGVAFAFRDMFAAIRTTGTTIERATAIGGGSRSVYWLKAIATALGIPIDVPEEGDYGAAFGAARLALIAADGCIPADVCSSPPVALTIDPVESLLPAYEEAYERFRALYPAA